MVFRNYSALYPEVIDKTVEWRLCGDATRMTETKLCDRCWELEKRIKDSPEIALRILENIAGKGD